MLKTLKIALISMALIPSLYSMSSFAAPATTFYPSAEDYRKLDSETLRRLVVSREMLEKNGSVVICSTPEGLPQAVLNLLYNKDVKKDLTGKVTQMVSLNNSTGQICAQIEKN